MSAALKHGLAAKTILSLQSVFGRYAIKEAIVYGSRAKGNYKPGSDIDISLVAPELTTTELLKIENEIEELMLPYKVDLSLLHQIEDQDLIDHIRRVGQAL